MAYVLSVGGGGGVVAPSAPSLHHCVKVKDFRIFVFILYFTSVIIRW